ncbi:nucleotidyltransferase domain-containing protein [Candidatus Woesearchaeota archaeon]|nr:nucleotidyltransferase domain-containing protein [Candidatus Woesearchaeota archaeon]
MKTIGTSKIMYLFYRNTDKSFHLREIARRTGLNENSASRFLNQLEKEGFLTSRKDANLKKYSSKKNLKTFALFTLFDVERLSMLPSIRKNAIACFLDKLTEKPVIAFLFGSTAKGTYTEDSDIDLLLITNKKMDTGNAERYAESQTAIRINVFQMTFLDFKTELRMKQDYVVQSALNTGYPITNHVFFYEVYYNEAV